ncbi:MAG: hypothetical protein M0Q91_17150 [Methanoregula sp.]|jgi:hypothetical protein|nr:hypothetical protein [Methanoregula sp.]
MIIPMSSGDRNAKQLFTLIGDNRVLLNLHPGQHKATISKARFVAVLAGSQSGKTSYGPWWLQREIVKNGPGDYLAVAPSYEMFKLKMLPEMLKVFCDVLKIGRYFPSTKVIELKDPVSGTFWARHAYDVMYGRILLRSAGSSKESAGVAGLESVTAKACWFDEPGMDGVYIQAWEAILRRLSLASGVRHDGGTTGGRVLLTTTVYNMGWLYREIYVPWKAGIRDIEVIQFDSTENPQFPIEEFERARESMPEWRFNMMYRGQFDRPAGMIYQDFDPALHVCDPFPIPPYWNQYVGIDPGAINTATVWMTLDPSSDVLYLYRETLEGTLTSAQHAQRALDHAAQFPRANFTWIGGCQSEKQFRMDWQTAGVPVQEPPIFEVEGGIDKVIGLFKARKLVIFRTCAKTIQQMLEYSRKVDQYGDAVEEIANKEQYHHLDALRYGALGKVIGQLDLSTWKFY